MCSYMILCDDICLVHLIVIKYWYVILCDFQLVMYLFILFPFVSIKAHQGMGVEKLRLLETL